MLYNSIFCFTFVNRKKNGQKWPITLIVTKMKDRIRQIMESQHMTQQVFADYIGQSPATLSSIFNGRTRPTLNIVEAVKKKIPNISTDWLMFGVGDMYLPDQSNPEAQGDTSLPQGDELYGTGGGQVSQNLMLDFETAPATIPQNGVPTSSATNSVKTTRSETYPKEVKIIDKPQRRITEIRIFYDDQTFDVFEPKKK